jgi:uncharacterized protein YhfF
MWPRVDGLRTVELGFPGEQRERLNGYVLHGDKRATAGLLAEYAEQGEALEHVGEVMVLIDSTGGDVGRIRVTEVVQRRFADVPWEFADAEGEGFRDLEHWRDGHRQHWAKEGREIGDDTELVCLAFDLLQPLGAGDAGEES